jgi:hypothetical protein
MRPLIKITTLLFIPLMLGCFALLPTAQAVSPAPDGDYPNGNTAEGQEALDSLTTGVWDTSVGAASLFSDTTGSFNTAVGTNALRFDSTGIQNTAVGVQTLKFLTTGAHNTAVGVNALAFDTTAIQNTAIGQGALENNNANFNVAAGYRALNHNTTGIGNTATGFEALDSNTIGFGNTACGFSALFNTTGRGNLALGSEAGINITVGNDNIDIGDKGVAGDSNTIRIGAAGFQTKTFIAGISGATVANGLEVVVDANGQLGTTGSSERFKTEIKPMDKASEAILALKPVTFHYKKELDPKGVPQFGLVAEDVAKVNPDLVAPDAKGEIYTVRYDAVNAMLLNEFLKARRQIDAQQKQIEALTAGLQKVSAQLELNKPTPRTVNNQ